MSEEQVLYCIRCGARVQPEERFGQLRPVCPRCGWIYFADPKVAAAAIIERDGQILLVRRVNEPQRGLWSVPAGFIDAGEDPARAAERECREETGLIVRVTRLLGVLAGREHAKGADIVLAYQAEITGGVLKAGDDADRALFFAFDRLPELAFEATQKMIAMVHQ